MPDAYPLASLLSVRQFREETAKRNVSHAQTAVREAKQFVEQKKAELESWRLWRREETDRRYAGLIGQTVKIEQIDAFHHGLALLAAQELQKESEVGEALKAMERSEAALAKAQNEVSTARKNTAKIEAHKAIWDEESKKATERAEDLEFEEFKPMKPLGESSEDNDIQ